jgi:hypothetical protein
MNFFGAMLDDLRSSVGAVRGAMMPGVRALTDKERIDLATMHRDGIRRELANRSAAAQEHDEKQQLAYWHLWRLIRPVTAGAIPPEIFNPLVSEHVELALSVVGDYDGVREQPGEFAECLYRPVSDLPYPRAVVRRCCEFLISIADGDPGAYDGDHELLAKERDALGLALFSLDYFLDLPASEIPRRTVENLEYVKHQYLSGSTPPPKPSPGDVVLRKPSGVTDSVDQIIGVSDEDEWLILTTSGSSMQVVRSAQAGKWDEVTVIAPAAAEWLTLTPSGGTPSYGQ